MLTKLSCGDYIDPREVIYIDEIFCDDINKPTCQFYIMYRNGMQMYYNDDDLQKMQDLKQEIVDICNQKEINSSTNLTDEHRYLLLFQTIQKFKVDCIKKHNFEKACKYRDIEKILISMRH